MQHRSRSVPSVSEAPSDRSLAHQDSRPTPASSSERSRGEGATAVLGSFSLSVQDLIDGLLRRGASLNDQPGIAFESLDPASQSRVVAQGDLFDAGTSQKRGAHLGDQFFLAMPIITTGVNFMKGQRDREPHLMGYRDPAQREQIIVPEAVMLLIEAIRQGKILPPRFTR